jgi:hypothetical protein
MAEVPVPSILRNLTGSGIFPANRHSCTIVIRCVNSPEAYLAIIERMALAGSVS